MVIKCPNYNFVLFSIGQTLVVLRSDSMKRNYGGFIFHLHFICCLIWGLGPKGPLAYQKSQGNSQQPPAFSKLQHCTEVRFASFLSGGFTTTAVINPPERKLAKHTSVYC